MGIIRFLNYLNEWVLYVFLDNKMYSIHWAYCVLCRSKYVLGLLLVLNQSLIRKDVSSNQTLKPACMFENEMHFFIYIFPH